MDPIITSDNDSKTIGMAIAKTSGLTDEIAKASRSIHKLGTALSNVIDIVKKLQVLAIYGAYKTPDGNIEYREGDRKVVFDISLDELVFYINDERVKSIHKDGNVYLYKDNLCYDVKRDMLYKNHKLVAGGYYVVIDGHDIRDSYYDEESIERYKKLKAKKWNKKRPFFNKRKYFVELKQFRTALDWARRMMNMLPRYKEARSEADRMKKLVIQNSSLLEGEME